MWALRKTFVAIRSAKVSHSVAIRSAKVSHSVAIRSAKVSHSVAFRSAKVSKLSRSERRQKPSYGTPDPSVSVTRRSASRFSKTSAPPPIQRTSTRSTRVRLPSPKCSRDPKWLW